MFLLLFFPFSPFRAQAKKAARMCKYEDPLSFLRSTRLSRNAWQTQVLVFRLTILSLDPALTLAQSKSKSKRERGQETGLIWIKNNKKCQDACKKYAMRLKSS
ncbi:hypothetical protein BC939DRAFT_446424 [Gamsiella multidivaricata]|uniref:uncharacterized protein n=1 Tax=Gamsiella multidivaricata TaxID=101098 RepID=UPI0022212060|nr:uncharacterized protein BC939DRAFT_446424 [Gamsiella multidivaricata]KAI7826984.1 hypothetical protein BC939DRAFT_446424 [Gamsiella multidivaricata]